MMKSIAPSHATRACRARLISLAIALLAAATASAQQAAPAAPGAAAPAASAPPFAVRPEVAAAVNQAVDLYRGGKVPEAKARIEQAQAATANPLPSETTAMHRIRGLLEMQLGDFAGAVKSLEAALAIGAQNDSDALQVEENLARAQFNLKNYAAALAAARKAQARPASKEATLAPLMVRATYLQNDYAGAIKLLEAQQQREGKLGVDDLRMLASSYGNVKNEPAYVAVMERLLREHGRSEYWPDLLSRVQLMPGWQQRWDIDLYRLRMQLDMMDEADDFLVLADMAARAGLPAEAQKVLDAGFAKGLIGKGAKAAEHQKFRAAVSKQAADDRQSLSAAAARAPAVADARAATNTFNTGAAMVGAGQAERGLELMKAALAGPLPDVAQARLQYAQALQTAGKATEAAEQLKAVAGQEGLGLLARLWQAALATPAAAKKS